MLPRFSVALAAVRPAFTTFALICVSLGCDRDPSPSDARPSATTSAPAVATVAPAAPEMRPPDIIVDHGYIAIGADRVPAAEHGLADKVAIFLTGRPMVEGRAVDVVAMRNARPSEVVAVIAALTRAKATGAAIKSEARDNTTQRLPIALDSTFPPCTTVAWIAKNAAIDVWPAGGGTAKRIFKGLAGPDMTLGTEAVRSVGARCDSSDLVVGADDAMTWGLVFDLATMALQAPGARTTQAVLVPSAVPGRKLVID
jgi:hypothetical protein